MGFTPGHLGYSTGFKTGLGSGGGFNPPARVYDSVSLNYFSRAGITDTREKNAADDFIIGAKADATIWTALQNGVAYLMSPTSYGASLYNAVNSSFTLNGGAAPAHSASNGLVPNGSTQYLQSDFIFSTDVTVGKKYTCIYSNKKSGDAVNGEMWSAFVSTTQAYIVRPNSAGGNALLTDNATATQFTAASGSSDGTFIHNSYTDATREILRNGVSLGTTATGGGGSRPNIECYLFARNFAGSPAFYQPANLIGLIQTTEPLTQAQSITLQNLLDTYNDNVISGGRR